MVRSKVVRLGGPLFRYSAEDDAAVLRVVGARFGPALRPDSWVRFTIHAIADREHGALLATDEHGERWTLLTTPEAVDAIVAAAPSGRVEGTEVAASEFPDRREGWLDELGPSAEA